MAKFKIGETLQVKHLLAAKETLSRPQEPSIAFLYKQDLDYLVTIGFITISQKKDLLQGKNVKGVMIYPNPI